MRVYTTMAFIVLAVQLQAQTVNDMIRKGNDYYRQGQYEQAAKEYSEAIKKEPGNETAKFNLAAASSRLGKDADATMIYDELGRLGSDESLKAKSFYNKGAVLSKQKKLEESIDAYKEALRLDPADKEARENLQKALLELKKKQPPQKKEENKQQKQQQQKQQQSKLSQKEAEQRLKLLEQKEKEVQQRLQKEKSKTGGSQTKDW